MAALQTRLDQVHLKSILSPLQYKVTQEKYTEK